MKKCALVFCLFSTVSVAMAQQPMPMGRVNASAKNYHAADGSALTKNASDDELQQALTDSYAQEPEFNEVVAKVKKHRVTLTGKVLNSETRRRAEQVAERTEGVRSVRNSLKIGNVELVHSDSALTSAH